ncbi:MAG: TetR/AcrR family transcriptional regulator [Firmicutes bacterium]|nr:TetR/AcrR family transcriptional regulator [Bacillota bacterium]
MPKIVDHDKRKEEITRKALMVFIEKGYYNTNLVDISEKCGIGRTTLYRYFKNKDEIFQYALIHITGIIKNEFKRVMELKDVSFIDKIKILISRLVTEYKNSNMIIALIDYWLIMRRENNYIFNRMYESMQEIRNAFKQLLYEGIKSREIKPVDNEKMTITLYALLESLVLHLSYDKTDSVDEHLKTVNILIDGLRA